MTTTYTLNGYRITYDDTVSDNSNGALEDPAVDFQTSVLTFEFASDVSEISYNTSTLIGAGGFDPDDPNINVELVPSPVRTAIDGQSVDFIHRSEEHTSELQSPVPISYAVFCLKKKKKNIQ